MGRNRQSQADLDDSDASADDGEVFDADNSKGDSDTDATVTEDLDVDAELDIEDQIQFFGGNAHPPEYYRQAVETFDESAFDSEDYSPGTDKLLGAVEEQWRLYFQALSSKTRQYDPQQTLESISIRLLYNSFDWKLNQKVN